ncbi:hypothetical protein PanWU01x14_298950 [Parasponia andersonii]|uniref:Uncharacterized protein n=1 Tax=Parasponia andersonii TaxID=3476 RepID=A0A2P5AUH6_PARAD|nr:hypothetical protein PanWU01x14_298950 [Parasponia andersonii]
MLEFIYHPLIQRFRFLFLDEIQRSRFTILAKLLSFDGTHKDSRGRPITFNVCGPLSPFKWASFLQLAILTAHNLRSRNSHGAAV